MKRTSYLTIGEVNPSTKKRFYDLMHRMSKRKENTLIRLMQVFEDCMEGREFDKT